MTAPEAPLSTSPSSSPAQEPAPASMAGPVNAAPPAAQGDLPARSASLSAILLILTMAFGVWQLFGAGREVAGVKLDANEIRSGRASAALEKQLNANLPAREGLIGFANGLRFLLLRGANSQVRVGRDNWLFLSEEMQPHARSRENLTTRVELMTQVSRQLQKDGVALVVLLVPDKIRVYPQHAWWATHDRERHALALQLLAQRQVFTVDPLPALQQAASHAVYYHSDTHWNQRGAQIAAQQVALQVTHLMPQITSRMGGTPPNQATASGKPALPWEPTEFELHPSGPQQERAGDLLRLMGLEHSPNWLRPLPDRETPLQIKQTSADAPAGLLDDVALPVVLTGTSYSLRGQFHGFLQQALHAKILNAAKDGAGFMQATQAYLADEAYKSAKPKLVIWEVPERFLSMPLEGELAWQKQLATKP